MLILDNIIFSLKSQGKTQKDLTDYLGVTQNVFTNWKNGRNQSWRKYLPQIAEFLGLTVDELISGQKKDAPAAAGASEQQLIQLYQRLSPKNQDLLYALLQSMLAQQEAEQ